MVDDILPPPERAAKTALGTSTIGSYVKANDILKSTIPKGRTLDFGSGKGLGANLIGADTYEPYVKSEPKYNKANQIKSNSYDKVTSLNVLNTIEPNARKEAVNNIGRVLKPNGIAIISTRGKDVEDAKIKTKVRDGYVIGKGEQARFQKGFTQEELKNYTQKTLGGNFKVENVKGLGKAAIKVTKLNISPTPAYKTLSIKGANFPGGKILKRFNEGGTVMKKQMEMFEDGGLKDEGGMTDEVSGNDVPSGSTREEVRDDIPAQLSEGEFVFPADVVRFIGLEKLMTIRQEAKQGLKQMEAMGQMGNSDEATMRDDMPFDINDLDMEDEVEYNRGGVVEAANGTYVAPTVPTGIQTLGTNPMGNPVGVTQQVADGVSGSTQGTPYTPNIGNMYTPAAQAYAPVSYNEFLGPSAGGAPTTENVRYFNAATGQSRMIPHLVNADGSRGATLYPIPEGFVLQEEAPKEAAKKTTTPTAKVQPVEDTGNDSQDIEEREREEAMYGIGGGRVSLGGKLDIEKTNRLGGPVRGSYLTKESTTFGIQYGTTKEKGLVNFAKGVGKVAGLASGINLGPIAILGKGAFDAYQYSIGNMPPDKVGIYTTNGISTVVPASVHNVIAVNPRGAIGLALVEHSKRQKTRFDEIKKGNPKLSKKEIIKIVTEEIKFNVGSEDIKQSVEQLVTNSDGTANIEKFNKLSSAVKENYYQASDDVEEDKPTTSSVPTSFTPTTGMFDSDDSDEQQSYDGGDSPSSSSDQGLGDINTDDFFNTGGLAGKKKKTPKPKKMKRGGLASR